MPSLKARIGQVTTYRDAEAHEQRMRVPVLLTDESGAIVYEHVQSFPLTATVDEIQAHAAKVRDTYAEDAARHEATKELQTQQDAAAQTAAQISGLEIQ
jgi:hypothetical protein